MALAACGGSGRTSAPLRVTRFPEAEALFHTDPRWLGGDAVYSIDLGNSRVLWLFGDSFIATSSQHSRSQARMPRNTVALQTGYDPSTASMKFYWSQDANGPSAFFAHPDPAKWYWPGHGVRIADQLLIFLSEQSATHSGLGFRTTGWAAVRIDNADAPCDQWAFRTMTTSDPFAIAIGSAVQVREGYLYAFAYPEASAGPVFLARWPVSAVPHGDLSGPEWFLGPAGWKVQGSLPHAPPPLFGSGQSEFNVYPDPPHAAQLIVQTVGFSSCPLAYRTASALTGPWSSPHEFYRPPEMGRPHVLIYSAKVHPMLTAPGADFVASYSTNSTDFSTLVSDTSLYYPRFLKATWTS